MAASFTTDETGVSFPRQVEGIVYTFRAENIHRGPLGISARVSIFDERGFALAFDLLPLENLRARRDFAREAHSRILDAAQKKAYVEKDLRIDLDDFCGRVWRVWIARYRSRDIGGDLTIGPPEFLLSPYIVDGAGTILFGPPGRGKSYISLAMAISMDAGCRQLWECDQRKVLFLNLERSEQSIKRRMAAVNLALGLEAERPISMMNARGRRLGDLMEAIREDVREKGIRVIILDSLSRVGLGSLTEDMPANEAMDCLNEMVGTWLALGHTARKDSTHVFGSQMFDAAADVIVQAKSQRVGDDSLGIGLQVMKANDIRYPPFRRLALCFDAHGLSEMREAGDNEFPELLGPAALNLPGELFDYLLEVGRASPTQIAKDTGHARAAISRALQDARFMNLGKDGRYTMYGIRQSARPADEEAPGPQQQELME